MDHFLNLRAFRTVQAKPLLQKTKGQPKQKRVRTQGIAFSTRYTTTNRNHTMTVKKQLIENESKGHWLEAAPGEHFLIRIAGSKTNNLYSVTKFLSDPGSGTPIHLTRERINICWWWNERCECCMEKRPSTPTAGTMVSLLRGIRHAWGNPTDRPVRLIMAAVPGGCAEALRVIAKTNRDQLDLTALAKKICGDKYRPLLFWC